MWHERLRDRFDVRRRRSQAWALLARALYRGCEIGREIPPELYQAVAQVLAFVLYLRTRGSSAGLWDWDLRGVQRPEAPRIVRTPIC